MEADLQGNWSLSFTIRSHERRLEHSDFKTFSLWGISDYMQREREKKNPQIAYTHTWTGGR